MEGVKAVTQQNWNVEIIPVYRREMDVLILGVSKCLDMVRNDSGQNWKSNVRIPTKRSAELAVEVITEVTGTCI